MPPRTIGRPCPGCLLPSPCEHTPPPTGASSLPVAVAARAVSGRQAAALPHGARWHRAEKTAT